MKTLSIIGGGSASLMLAAHIDTSQYDVTIYEQKKGLGRKFLVAGEGGLNLTYHAPISDLISQYEPSEFLAKSIRQFTNDDLREWLHSIGIPTFIGSSNRVFPDLGMKPIEVLNTVGKFITSKGVNIKFDSKWMGWNEDGTLKFENMEPVLSDIVVFALGGASWKVTGSDGRWKKKFEKRGIKVNPFHAANCAFQIDWDTQFIKAHEGKPLKNIALSYEGRLAKGELVVTQFGLEGNAIYALSHKIQETLLNGKPAIIYLDLKPMIAHDHLLSKFQNSSLRSTTQILQKTLNLDRTSIAILKQFTDKKTFTNPRLLMEKIKAVPIKVIVADNMDKAISTIGGIALEEVSEHFQLHKIPNNYAIGEMLDWYAPTGGYLLQGCFSMGYRLAQWLNKE